MESIPFISVVCPVYNEEKHIDGCIESILAQDYPQDRMEVLLIDGRSTDRTRERLQAYSEKYPFIRWYDNPCKYVPQALNIGIGNAKGEVIIRLDAHCMYPSDYFSVLVRNLYRLGADNVGGVWKTVPGTSSGLGLAMAIASSHGFGVGNSLHKTGADHIQQVDTVPFGCFRREVFDRIGLFDEELIRNQDDEFNARIVQSGGRIFLIPQLEIVYKARDRMSKLLKMYFQYGLFKPLVNKKLKKPASIRQFVPVFFVAGVFAGLPLSIFFPVIRWVYIGVLSLYFLTGFLIGIRQASKHKKPSLAYLLPIMFFLIHLSYGCGYWKGIFYLLIGKKFTIKDNR